MVAFANYRIWDTGGLSKPILFLLILTGSFLAFYNICLWTAGHVPSLQWKQGGPWKPAQVFLVVFLGIMFVDLATLFLCKYPGLLSTDSYNQVTQALTGAYSNHHPLVHTLVIKLCIDAGFAAFGDLNAAVACYSTLQILFMAAAFAFAVATVAELGAPHWLIVALGLFFAFMPYHIMYSMSMWKDVPFGGFVLLFAVFFFRCVSDMSLRLFNYAGLAISALGVCLFRSNGLFAFILAFLVFVALWRLENKRALFLMSGVIICALVVKHPVLTALDVTPPDTIESLSIPAQQLARDFTENGDWSDKDKALLSEVVDTNRIPNTYVPSISDPIKSLVREKGDQDYLKSHAIDFMRLYFERGFMHPFSFLKGWIDETRGYWNSGYPYWRWLPSIQVEENPTDITGDVRSEELNGIVDKYLAKFESWPMLQPFVSIGLFDWMALGVLFVAIVRRGRIGIMLAVPMLAAVVSLLVATPVFSEFRYDYAVFCTLPIAVTLALRPGANQDAGQLIMANRHADVIDIC